MGLENYSEYLESTYAILFVILYCIWDKCIEKIEINCIGEKKKHIEKIEHEIQQSRSEEVPQPIDNGFWEDHHLCNDPNCEIHLFWEAVRHQPLVDRGEDNEYFSDWSDLSMTEETE
jgi:hypothetical protein